MEKNEIKSYEGSLFLKYHKGIVYNIILLKDGRLSSCCSSGKIIIYKKQTFQIEQIINGENGFIFHLELSNHNIVAVCNNSLLEIYELNNNKNILSQQIKIKIQWYKSLCRKVFEIDNNTFALYLKYGFINIYKKDNNNKYTKILEKKIHHRNNYDHLNILKINKSIVVSTRCNSNSLHFLDIKNQFKNIATINNIKCSERKNSLLMINDIILIVGSRKANGIYLIDTKNYFVIKHIMQGIAFYSMIKLSNGNLLVGYKDINNKSGLTEYKYEEEKLIEINFVKEEKFILNLCEMKDGNIAALSVNNKRIKIFKNIKYNK